MDLTAVERALASLPDPESALGAVLTYLASREDLRTRVHGYFEYQRKAVRSSDSGPGRKTVPFAFERAARDLLYDLPDHPSLIGDRQGWWLLHRRATRAVLLRPGQVPPSPADLEAADHATRPDDFGPHHLPTDPWPDSLRESALRHLAQDATLTEEGRRAARKVIDNDVAPVGRSRQAVPSVAARGPAGGPGRDLSHTRLRSRARPARGVHAGPATSPP
ncbi:hypothetical protein [Streptomyces sp. NPDC086010]|uniref:hypothetical protein n=1 Tax=Streptomyces sp. NPDC086010 TaxID=3365745 RepID=UPI0037D3D45B